MGCNEGNNKNGNAVSVTVVAVLVIIIVFLAVLLIKKQHKADAPQPSQSPDILVHTPSADLNTHTPGTSAPVSPEPSDTADVTPTPMPQSEYDYSKPVPQGSEVSKDSFTDAIFIGDSRMEDFGFFSGLAGKAKFYTHIGLTVNHLVSDDESKLTRFKINGEELTFEEAIRKNSDFSRVYIMLGYNELGWPYIDSFIEYYVNVINMIKTVQPDADIYVECIIPVAREISGDGVDPETENNENIAKFNQAIQKMCEDNKYYYVNVQETLVDGEGYLPDGSASDGIHLKKEYCIKWYEYIATHCVDIPA